MSQETYATVSQIKTKNPTEAIRMARSNPEGCAGYFGWLACRAPSCPYNTTGVKVSNWWLFLCLSYFSCFVVGIAFAVAGFASMGIEMAAVGVVLVIGWRMFGFPL